MILTTETFQDYALINYQNPDCSGIDDFKLDINRINRLERYLFQYKNTGNFNDRLVLNNLIILSNIFTISIMKELLFFKINSELYDILGTLLYFLNYISKTELDKYNINIIEELLNKLNKI